MSVWCSAFGATGYQMMAWFKDSNVKDSSAPQTPVNERHFSLPTTPRDILPGAMSLSDVYEVYWAMADGGLHLKDRWRFFRKYPRCFVGSEAIDWTVSKCTVVKTAVGAEAKRKVAVALCRLMVEASLLRHVGPGSTEGGAFLDDKHQFYRFVPQHERAREDRESDNLSETRCALDTPLNCIHHKSIACPYTALIHCTHTLLSYTTLIHCTRPLHSHTALTHCAHTVLTLLSHTALTHCALSLCSHTVLTHCSHKVRFGHAAEYARWVSARSRF
jgi:hypothetical protein